MQELWFIATTQEYKNKTLACKLSKKAVTDKAQQRFDVEL